MATRVYTPVLLTEQQRDFLLLLSGVSPSQVLAEEAAVQLLATAFTVKLATGVGRFGEAVDPEAARDDERTTVMIRKIPRRLTHEDLDIMLNRQTPGLESQVEFLYLPRDMARRSNRGFCFVNFHSSEGVSCLTSLLTEEARMSLPEGLRRCQVFYAKVQGRGEQLRKVIDQQEMTRTTVDDFEEIPIRRSHTTPKRR
jgi:hypothetical protein